MSALIDWDRLPTETPKSYAAFLAYVALGARRSVREAARQHHVKALSAGEIIGSQIRRSAVARLVLKAQVRGQTPEIIGSPVLGWQIIITACDLALVTRAHDVNRQLFLLGTRCKPAARGGSEDLCDIPERHLSARDAARKKN